MNPEDVKNKRRSISLSITLSRRVDLLARKKGVCASEIFRVAIDSYVTQELMEEAVLDRMNMEDIQKTQQAASRTNPHVYG